jgi:NADPH:quinone reductase-like Zn-dependent oxidoreductase
LRAVREIVAMGLLAPYSFVRSCRTLSGFNLSLLPNRFAELRAAADGIFLDARAGRIRPIVGRRFPFDELPEAHRALASRKTHGKLVVTVGAAP